MNFYDRPIIKKTLAIVCLLTSATAAIGIFLNQIQHRNDNTLLLIALMLISISCYTLVLKGHPKLGMFLLSFWLIIHSSIVHFINPLYATNTLMILPAMLLIAVLVLDIKTYTFLAVMGLLAYAVPEVWINTFHDHLTLESYVFVLISRIIVLSIISIFIYFVLHSYISATNEMAQNESLLEGILDRSPIGFLVHTKGIITYVNPTILRRGGFESPDEILGRSIWEFVRFEDRKDVQRRMFESMAGREHYLAQQNYMSATGELIRCEMYQSPITYRGQDSALVSLRDLGESRVEDSMTMMLIDRNPLPTILYTPQMNILYANEAMAKLLRMPLDEIIDASIQKFIAPQTMDAVAKTFSLFVEKGEYPPSSHPNLLTSEGEVIESESRNVKTRFRDGTAMLSVIINISEQIRIEQTIRESEHRYRTLFESSGEALLILKEGIVIDCNPMCYEIFATDRENIIGKKPADLSPEIQLDGTPSQEKEIEYNAEVLKNGSKHFDWLHKKADGTVFHAEVGLNRIVIEGETLLFASVRDISARMKAEEAIRLSQELLSTVFHASPSAMSITRASDYRFIDANESYCELSGYSHGELLDLTWKELNSVRSQVTLNLLEEKLRKEGEVVGEEVKFYNRSGEARFCILSVTPLNVRGEDSFLSIFFDITDRKQAESALLSSQKSLHLALEAAHLGMWDWDILTSKVYFHPQWKRIFDINDDVVVDKLDDMRKRIHDDDSLAVRKRVDEHLAGHTETYVSEHRMLHEDGTYHWVLDSGQVIQRSEEGLPLRAVGVTQDINDRRRIEEMMIQTEKMMSVGGLAAGMAHEINNPLAIIMQSVQNLARRLDPNMERNIETAKSYELDLENMQQYLEERGIPRYLQSIQTAGSRAAEIISNMLNFSRKSDTKKQRTNVHELIMRAIELAKNDYDLKKKYDIKQINFTLDFDRNVQFAICDAIEIEQVLLNLIQNAAHAVASVRETKDPEIKVATKAEDSYIHLTVADNGIGMSEDVRKRVFEPFFTTKAVGTGTGLGLSVSYFIITKNHNGMMHVDSTPGRGTAFHIYIPGEDLENGRQEWHLDS